MREDFLKSLFIQKYAMLLTILNTHYNNRIKRYNHNEKNRTSYMTTCINTRSSIE